MAKVAAGLLQDWVGSMRDWFVERAPEMVFQVFVFVLIIFLFTILARFVRRIVRKNVVNSKFKLSKLLQDMIVAFSGDCRAEVADGLEQVFGPRAEDIRGGPRELRLALEKVRSCAAVVKAQSEPALRYFTPEPAKKRGKRAR